MGRKLVLKTILICLGIFTILSAAAWFYIFSIYKIDTEQSTTVLVAATDIKANTILNESLFSKKTIKISASSESMLTDIIECQGSKTIGQINKGDYIYKYNLIPKNKIYTDDIRAIVLQATIEERLANLIHGGSLIDIIVTLNNSTEPPQVVLSKVRVDAVFDESGINAEGNEIGSKKAFLKLLLNKPQRERIYSAKANGTLAYELYCDETQKPSREGYKIRDPLEITDELKGVPSK